MVTYERITSGANQNNLTFGLGPSFAIKSEPWVKKKSSGMKKRASHCEPVCFMHSVLARQINWFGS